VFAEIEQVQKQASDNQDGEKTDKTSPTNTEIIKLNILDEELKILNETNEKFFKENQLLKSEINKSNNEISNLLKKVEDQNNLISQNVIDQEELKFLRLNLIHSSKCKKTAFKKGFKVGTQEYKDCILKKGKKLDD